MHRTLELAERGWGRVSPNPLVGALVVADGEVVGEGWHEGPGTPHAEVVALRQAGDRARGSTLLSSLEPCNRYGRTPPCTRAIMDAGVALAVVAASDPNLGPAEPGIAALRAAGIEVTPGVLAEEAERQNAAFLTHVRTGLPSVILKMAASLDGKSAAHDGSSRWITGEEARADVQRLRAWADAVVVGAGTVAADDPSLTVRDPRFTSATPPLRVVVSASGRLPTVRRLFDGSAPTLVATTERTSDRRREEWAAAGAEIQVCESDANGGVSLAALMAALGKRDVQGVLLEGGPTLAWSAVRDGVVDRIVFYLAPVLVGGTGANSALGGTGFAPIGEALGVTLTSVERIGDDLRLEGDVHRDR